METPRSQPATRQPEEVSIREKPTQPVAPPARDLATVLLETAASLRDMFFDYDRFDMAEEAVLAARHNAGLLAPILAEFQGVQVVVEGHCDERGSAEYNLALGDRRASAAAGALSEFGVARDRLQTITYGKEAPQCIEPNENCWKRNRRAHLLLRPGASSGTSSQSLSQVTTGVATPSPNR